MKRSEQIDSMETRGSSCSRGSRGSIDSRTSSSSSQVDWPKVRLGEVCETAAFLRKAILKEAFL